MHWYLKAFSDYANFAGRSSRREFWMFSILNPIFYIAIAMVCVFLGLSTKIATIYLMVSLIPSFAVSVRRMHDTNRSGWYLLIPFYTIVLFCLPGDTTENAYGPNPKGTTSI
ncbi:MAG: DUF805 domain-containing protein [Bdellovibrionales bacterium]|nr:DUF805 domain-containing protein [Bdellovibrionales bacterium]